MKNACGIFKAIYEKDKAYMMPPLYICSGLHKAYNSYLRGRLLYISASLFTTVTYRQRGHCAFAVDERWGAQVLSFPSAEADGQASLRNLSLLKHTKSL